MPTTPSSPNQTPRAEDEGRDEITPVPDEPGPRDVPDDEVIEHTLPTRASRQDSSGPP